MEQQLIRNYTPEKSYETETFHFFINNFYEHCYFTSDNR